MCSVKMPRLRRNRSGSRITRRSGSFSCPCARRRRRHGLEQQDDGGQGQHAGHGEQPAHADQAVEHRRADQREGEDKADRRADHRHHLGAMLLAGQVGGERGDRGRDRPRPLQHAAGDGPVHIGRPGGDEAAEGENQQANDDHPLAPPDIGGDAVGNLEDCLGQPVGAKREADQRQVVAPGQMHGVDGKDRQDQEQPEHAQREDGGQGDAGAALFRAHAVGSRDGHREETFGAMQREGEIVAGLANPPRRRAVRGLVAHLGARALKWLATHDLQTRHAPAAPPSAGLRRRLRHRRRHPATRRPFRQARSGTLRSPGRRGQRCPGLLERGTPAARSTLRLLPCLLRRALPAQSDQL